MHSNCSEYEAEGSASISRPAPTRAETLVVFNSSPVAQWSRGMIPALGAGGLEFESRLSPTFLLLLSKQVLFSKLYT